MLGSCCGGREGEQGAGQRDRAKVTPGRHNTPCYAANLVATTAVSSLFLHVLSIAVPSPWEETGEGMEVGEREKKQFSEKIPFQNTCPELFEGSRFVVFSSFPQE